MKIIRQALLLIFALSALSLPVSFKAKAKPLTTVAAARQPNIGVNGYFSVEKAQRGRTVQAAVVVEVPKGYHINANKTLSKFLIPTTLKIDNVGDGVKVSSISYPRAIVRKFSFSEDDLAVYEGRAVLRFTLTIPAGFPHTKMLVKAKVKYQSCSDEVCFAPATRDLDLWIGIAADKETPKRANGNIFGRKG
ncbi:MAG TPA: protein-disulfide reductase DsbD domain-containing protein [Pyrinomonadaceae bacterium]